jgi:hypothetical protein
MKEGRATGPLSLLDVLRLPGLSLATSVKRLLSAILINSCLILKKVTIVNALIGGCYPG